MLIVFLVDLSTSYAQTHVHEGLIGGIGDGIVLTSVTKRPPNLPLEHPPERTGDFDTNAVWLSGYWIWDPDKNAFSFVKGIYRVPPPGAEWQVPRWVKKEGYWVRLKGYWHPIDQKLERSQQIPVLCKVEEKLTDPPLSSCLYAPGSWIRDPKGNLRRSIPGEWVVLEKEWTYTPADYIFDGEGYILIPSYWDLPLAKRRGVASLEGDSASLDMLLSELFLSYPDHQFFLQEHFAKNPAYWVLKGSVPSWWLWKGSTLLSRTESWWLFWWWTHPGFPQPEWIDPSLAAKIYPPSTALVEKMQHKIPPPFLRSWGTAELDELLRVINKDRALFVSFIPDSEEARRALASLEPESPDAVASLKPGGKYPYLSLTGKPWPLFTEVKESETEQLFNQDFFPFGVEPLSLTSPLH